MRGADSLSETAQNVLANLITLLLGLTVAADDRRQVCPAGHFAHHGAGSCSFIFDTAGGVLFAKLVNLFLPEGKKLNPMIGAAGISPSP